MPDQTPMDFIFVDEKTIDRNNLRQGDLLLKTPELAESLSQAHPYYATADDYSHFLVLTQTCDLVRREGTCKSRYISIAAVRPLRTATSRELSKLARGNISGLPFPVGDSGRQILARQYLDRVINNTVDGLFFIPKHAALSVDSHLAAFLHLSVALRRDHYDACLSAKIGQLREIFAAKVGALLGDMYNRIGTPDLQEEANSQQIVRAFKDEFYDEMGLSDIVWLSDEQLRNLKKRVRSDLRETGAQTIPRERAEKLIDQVPDEREALAERAIEVLRKRNFFPDDPKKIESAKQFLVNDATFQRLTKR